MAIRALHRDTGNQYKRMVRWLQTSQKLWSLSCVNSPLCKEVGSRNLAIAFFDIPVLGRWMRRGGVRSLISGRKRKSLIFLDLGMFWADCLSPLHCLSLHLLFFVVVSQICMFPVGFKITSWTWPGKSFPDIETRKFNIALSSVSVCVNHFSFESPRPSSLWR